VCGILEEVFVASKHNMHGEVYGFVRYSKVRDIDKLLKAVNNEHFGQYRVIAMLARFDETVPKNGLREIAQAEGGV